MVTAPQQAILDTLAVLAAGLYLFVGFTLSRRPVSAENRGAMRAFILWWAGLGTVGLLAVAWRRADLGVYEPTLTVAYFAVVLTLLFAAVGGLLYYFLVLYTGDRRWFPWVVAFYVVLALGTAWMIVVQDPYVGVSEAGVTEIQYRDELPQGHPAGIAVAAGLILPPLIAAIGLVRFFFKVPGGALRFRILMVASGIILWFGYSALGSAVRIGSGTEQGFTGALVGQVLGVLSATLVLMAYRPPTFLARRFQATDAEEHEDRPERRTPPQMTPLLALDAPTVARVRNVPTIGRTRVIPPPTADGAGA